MIGRAGPTRLFRFRDLAVVALTIAMDATPSPGQGRAKVLPL